MNTISSTQSTIDLYALKKLQAAKVLEQLETEQQKKQEQNDSIEISQQAIQTLGNSTQAASNTSPLDSLVSAGTITQDQANAVLSVFQSVGNSIQTSGKYNNKTKTQNPLDSLVSAGTITQDQENSIKSALHKAMKANRPRNIESQTAANPLDSLVSSGTITQAQEDAIQSAFENAMNQ